MSADGSRAAQAMSSSFSTTLHDNTSSRDDRSDRTTPVCTHTRLYGIRPTHTAGYMASDLKKSENFLLSEISSLTWSLIYRNACDWLKQGHMEDL